jgi:hypothetical protein
MTMFITVVYFAIIQTSSLSLLSWRLRWHLLKYINDWHLSHEPRHRSVIKPLNNQRAASSVVFSDLRTVYLYVFSCISLFLCTTCIIQLAGHQSLIHTEFCITRVASKNHLCSFFMIATIYPCISWLLP